MYQYYSSEIGHRGDVYPVVYGIYLCMSGEDDDYAIRKEENREDRVDREDSVLFVEWYYG